MTEAQLQQKIIIEYRNQFKGLIFSVPNEAAYKNKIYKNTGLLAGVSDLIILKPNAECIFIELKVEDRKQRKGQKEFEKKVTEMGFKYYLVRSLEEFIKLGL